MLRKRRRIRYYNGPAYAARLTQRVWFPFAAVAVAALVLGLIVGVILSGVSSNSKLARPPKRELVTFGGVEAPSERYAALTALTAEVIDAAGLSESELKKGISNCDGNAVGVLLFDGELHYKSAADLGYAVGGSLEAEEIASSVRGKSLYGVACFVSSAFEETDAAKRAYEKGRELALLTEIADAGFRELFLFGLPSDESLVSEVGLFLAQVYDFAPNTRVGVVLDGDASDAQMARLVAATEANADSFALDLRGMSDEQAADAVERNAYFLTQYRMRVICDKESTVAETYELHSVVRFGE
ncbi:MAG: hypothetical protein E7606_00700 [Ruminococcaceae bacterium]|nr:hypothetical protein [Oscillospiraceae bacterium]